MYLLAMTIKFAWNKICMTKNISKLKTLTASNKGLSLYGSCLFVEFVTSVAHLAFLLGNNISKITQ